ncbi:hypothetical protein AB0M12_05095 [Nocardia vinacea]
MGGLLLPCNVVVHTDTSADGETVVIEAMNPQQMVDVSELSVMQAVAD